MGSQLRAAAPAYASE